MKKVLIFCLCILMLVIFVSCDSKYKITDIKHKKTLKKEVTTTISDYIENDSNVDLNATDRLRRDYNLGTCRELSGNITVVLFYIDDFESSWAQEEIVHFTKKEIVPGINFLEENAKKFDVDLDLDIKDVHSSIYYDSEVETDINKSGYATGDVLYQAAKAIGYSSDNDLIDKYTKKYDTEIICLTLFNKEGNSYALNPTRGSEDGTEEHGLIFAYDFNSTGEEPVGWQSSVVANNILYLYGAESFSKDKDRKKLAEEHYPRDVMLSNQYYISLNDIGEATAFYVGWIDKVPKILYHMDW